MIPSAPRKLSILSLSLASMVLLASAPSSDAAQRDRCTRARTTTLEANSRIVVHRTGPPDGGVVYACDRRTGRRTQLGGTNFFDLALIQGTGAIALRGDRIAFAYIADPDGAEGPSGVSIVSERLPFRHRSLWRQGRQEFVTEEGVSGAFAVVRVVIGRNGSVAWTSCRNAADRYDRCANDEPEVPVTVTAADAGLRQLTLLERSSSVNPRSLRTSPSGARFAWDADGTRRIAATP